MAGFSGKCGKKLSPSSKSRRIEWQLVSDDPNAMQGARKSGRERKRKMVMCLNSEGDNRKGKCRKSRGTKMEKDAS